MKRFFISFVGCLFMLSVLLAPLSAQTKEAAKQQAESQLKQMTPQQIDAKIKEYGMTRQDAEAKAKALGIDLNAYLQQRAAAVPAQEPPAATPGQQPAAPPAEGEPKKDVPLTPPPTGEGGLPFFGYGIFYGTPAAFEPTAVGPVDPDYVVGPDDVLRVTVWGQVEFQNELAVDKEGRIFIPTIGQVLVSGLTLEKAYDKLLKQMSRSYSGLVARQPTVWMDLTLAKLRPKRIFMMGEVGKPGGYTVSSYATVFNSLYSIGGPTVRGSLRDVRVVRGDKVIAHIDLYKYLIGADKTDDIRIQNSDIVFVPPRGRTVSINREVRRPAIFELLPGENLTKLLEFAGGALSTAYLERVQIDRIIPFKERAAGEAERRIIDVNFRAILNQGQDYPLQDGDRVTVYSIFDERVNVVTISGAVLRPGPYQLEKAGSVRSLILAAEGLEPRAYTGIAHLLRYNDDWLTQRIIPFELQAVLDDTTADIPLRLRDEVMVYSSEVMEVKSKFVTILGEVGSPGKYPLRANMTLEDLIPLAGGYTESAEQLQAEVARVTRRGLSGDSLVTLIHPKLPTVFVRTDAKGNKDSLSVRDVLAGGQFLLQHRDQIVIRTDPNYKLQQNVSIEGDVRYPGVYAIQRRGEMLSDLMARAGGSTATSYLGGAQFFRSSQRLLIDFEKALRRKGGEHDVLMLDGDRIVVPSRPHTVLVAGEVNKPGLLAFLEGESVGDYIDRAGGLTDSANYAVLTSPTGESRRVNFGFLRRDPTVLEGSSIAVTRTPPPLPEKEGESLATTIKDIFAITTSAATVAFLIWQVTK